MNKAIVIYQIIYNSMIKESYNFSIMLAYIYFFLYFLSLHLYSLINLFLVLYIEGLIII